jgi:hypothetical protein
MCIVPADPSRKDSPALNQFAKPIPLAQFLENAATALDDIPVVICLSKEFKNFTL